MDGTVFPPCILAWGQTMVWVIVNSSKKTSASTPQGSYDCYIQCSWLHNRPPSTHASAGHSWTLTDKSSLVSYVVMPPFSWVLVHTGFCLCPPRVFLQSCGNSVSNPTGLKSQIPWGFSVPLSNPQVGESVVGPRTFATVGELLWYHCSQFMDHLLHGSIMGLMATSSKRIYATWWGPQVCCGQSLCPAAGYCWLVPLQKTLKHSKAHK